jgi:hypothetical protein
METRPVATRTDSSPKHDRLRSAYARERIADAILGVALDVVEPFAGDYLSADDYNRLCGLLQGPVGEATDAALTTISRELAIVADAEPDLARRLQGAARRRG